MQAQLTVVAALVFLVLLFAIGINAYEMNIRKANADRMLNLALSIAADIQYLKNQRAMSKADRQAGFSDVTFESIGYQAQNSTYQTVDGQFTLESSYDKVVITGKGKLLTIGGRGVHNIVKVAVTGLGAGDLETYVSHYEDNSELLASQMHGASIVFESPDSMQVDKEYQFVLFVRRDYVRDSLVVELQEYTSDPNYAAFNSNSGSPITTDSINITSSVEAYLNGNGFKITNFSPVEQDIGSELTTTWMWGVTPLTKDQLTLSLTLNALVTVGGQRRPRTVKTYKREVDVYKPNLSAFLGWTDRNSGALMSLLSTITAALLAFFLGRKSKEKLKGPEGRVIRPQRVMPNIRN